MDKHISIITANFNSEKYIAQTIESVLAQKYTDWEMIIVDDNSTDKSMQIVDEYKKKDKRIHSIRLKSNQGPAVARNTGIEKAKGRYITFIDSDDLWEPNFLNLAIEKMINEDYSFVFASYYRKNEDLSEDLGTFIVPEKVAYYDLLKTCPISCLTAIYDTKEIGKFFMPEIIKRQDYGLWLRLLKEIDFAYGIRQPLATYRIRKGSVSSNKFKAAQYQWKIYRDVEKLGLLKSFYYFLHYAVNGILKYR